VDEEIKKGASFQ
jgi:putative transposase